MSSYSGTLNPTNKSRPALQNSGMKSGQPGLVCLDGLFRGSGSLALMGLILIMLIARIIRIRVANIISWLWAMILEKCVFSGFSINEKTKLFF